MKLLFFSMHGCAAQEIAILCVKSGVEVFFPRKDDSAGIKTLTKDVEHQFLNQLGAKTIQNSEELSDRFSSGEFDAVMLANPKQVQQYRSFSSLRKEVPFIIRHGLNSFSKFLQSGTKNFLTCSRQATYMMPGCHCFVSKKLIPWKHFPKGLWPEEKSGLASYIHSYQNKFPGEYSKFQELALLLEKKGIVLRNFGEDSLYGRVDDLDSMSKSVATVHIKGGNAVCNAVIRSMAVGTPVLMDEWTYNRCFFDQIEGVIVKQSVEELAVEAEKLSTDEDYLEEESTRIYQIAKKQFDWDEDLGQRFLQFLETLRV